MIDQTRKSHTENHALRGGQFPSGRLRLLVTLLGLVVSGTILSQSLSSPTLPPSHSPERKNCKACHGSAYDEANETLLDEGEGLFEPLAYEPLAVGAGKINGYASSNSVPQGSSIDFHTSTSIAAYDIYIFREGASSELMLTVTDLPGGHYTCGPVGVPAGQEDVDLGCDWPVAYTLNVPSDWPSGIYVANLLDEDSSPGGDGYYVIFIVTEDQPGSTADIVFQLSTNTWHAYSYYNDLSFYTEPPMRRITFDRPLYRGACNPSVGCRVRWEMPLARWLESEGYAVEYVANEDLHVDPTLLFNYSLFLSVGHDEYWSKEMRDQIDAFIDAGGNVAFFSGNTGYRQVRYQDGGRTLVCYKGDLEQDPLYGVDNSRVATAFGREPIPSWPENSTTGVGWRNGGYVNTPDTGTVGRYTVYRSDHWIYAGTGLRDENEFWYEPEKEIEVDGALFTWEAGLPVVTGEDETPLNFIILGLQRSTRGYATMGIYTRDGGGTAFNASTMGWGRGLWPENNPEDYEIVRQITRNVMDTLSSGESPPPPTYPLQETSFTYQPTNPLDEVITFTAIITPSHASPPITYTWQLGDGEPVISTGSSVISHTYGAAGTYIVSVIVTNPQGYSSYAQIITVASASESEVDYHHIFLPFAAKNSILPNRDAVTHRR